MKLIARSLMALAACLIVGIAAYLTLSSNLDAGVYRVDADSIGIPFIESILTSIVLFAFLLAAAGLVALSRFLGRRMKIITKVLAAVFGILATLLAAAGVYSWAIPNHYGMAFSYALVILVALFFSYQDIYRSWTTDLLLVAQGRSLWSLDAAKARRPLARPLAVTNRMGPAFRILFSAAIAVALGVVSPIIAFWLSGSTVLAMATAFSWTGNPFTIGIALWWIVTILACSLPIALVAKHRAPWFGFVAAVVLATLEFQITQPFGGSTSLSDPLFVTITIEALIVFPLASYFWSQVLSRSKGAKS